MDDATSGRPGDWPPTPYARTIGAAHGQAMVRDDIRASLLLGFAALLVLLAGVGGWAATANLEGAVIAQATVVVETNVKKVQHPSGGVIGQINVREGDVVNAGDVVMRLDATVTRASLGIVTSQLDEHAIRLARLKAERDGAVRFEVPSMLVSRVHELRIAEIVSGEQALMESRRADLTGLAAQLAARVDQLEEEINGLHAQRAAKTREIELVRRELGEIQKLWTKNLVPLSKLIAMERDAVRIEGERAQLSAAVAQAKSKIAETRLQALQQEQEHKTSVIREMRDIEAKTAELGERRVAAEDQLKRIDIVAPQTGTVHQLAVHTVGGVVSAGEPVMMIVPRDDTLLVEARVAPNAISQVRSGQLAYVRFTAFDHNTTPELSARVTRVSADLRHDQRTGQSFYEARIALPPGEMAKLHGQKLVPGMPVEVHIRTEQRTALSYFTKPLGDQLARTFKER